MYTNRPMNDKERGTVLQKIHALSAFPVPEPEHQGAVNGAHRRLNTLFEPFNKALGAVKTARYQLLLQERQLQGHIHALDGKVERFWEALKHKAQNQDDGETVLMHYGLCDDQYLPETRGLQEKLDITRTLIEGEEISIQAGLPTLMLPSVVDLEHGLKKVGRAIGNRAEKAKKLAVLNNDLDEVREQSDHYLLDLIGYLAVAYRGKKVTGLYRILDELGITQPPSTEKKELNHEALFEEPEPCLV